MTKIFYIYFHSDFDGICSAALFSELIEYFNKFFYGDLDFQFKYIDVDYDTDKNWVESKLNTPNAVLDFRFHPSADWWFDHHVSAFKNFRIKEKFKNNSKQFWDVSYPSCPLLIKDHFLKHFPLFFSEYFDKYEEWIKWSNIIDSAKYNSPKDLIELKHPCLQINATLAIERTNDYYQYLIRNIKKKTPKEVSKLKRVNRYFSEFQEKQRNVIEIFEKLIIYHKKEKVAFLDQAHLENILFQRYISYYFFEQANYTIGIYKKTNSHYSVSIGKNPWKKFESKNIGKICKRYGGGGRQDVGAVYAGTYNEAISIANKILKNFSTN